MRFASTTAGVDMYSVGTYDGALVSGYHSHSHSHSRGPEPARYVSAIHALLVGVPAG